MNVLLDLDGTLIDPRPGFVNCIRHAFHALKIDPPSDVDIASHIGPPLEETLAKLLCFEQQKHIPNAVRLYRARYSSAGLYENSMYDGIQDALESLYDRGARLFLATSKPRAFAIRILENFEITRFFSGIYGSGFDGSLSDKRHLLAHLLEQESLQAEESVTVGDRAHDVRGALANGVRPLGVLWDYGTLKELREAGAQALVRDPIELPDAASCKLPENDV